MIRVLLPLLLVACNAQPADDWETPERAGPQWTVRPEVALSVAASRCQQAAVRASIAWWSVVDGRQLAVRAVEADAYELVDPPYGVIAVLPGPMLRPGAVESGWVYPTDGGDRLHSAELRVGGCDVRAVAHGLGHALGYVHSPSGVMRREHGPGEW